MAYTNGSPIRKMLVDEVIHPVHDYRILPKDYKLAELTQSLNQDFDADSLAMLNDASPETVFFVNDGGKHIVCSPTSTKEIQADGTIIPWVSTIDEKGEAFGIKCVFEGNVITSAKLVKMDSPYVKVAKGYMEVRTNQNPIKLTTQVMKPVEVGDTILGFEYVEEETECTLPPIEPIVHYPKSLLFTSPTPFTITTVQTETETPGWYGDGDLEVGVNGVDFTDITEINTPFTIESEFNFDLGSHALFIRGVGNSTLNNTKFKCSGNNVVLQGYLSAVLDWTEEATTIGEGAYVGVFSGSSAYTDCSGLIMPSVLSEGALAGAFSGCSNLTIAPDLPAVELYEECYAEMFSGCASLIKSPKLKAVTLEPYCYSGMFSECANLIMPPALPATTLAEGCYAGMFLGCTSLTTSPKLSAETLEPLCYQSMFNGCASLINVNSFTPTTMAQSACSSMFAGCSKLTSFPDLTCTSLAKACYAGMFQECTSLMIAPALPATTLAVECYNEMFKGCTSIGTPAALPATSYPEGCYHSMFEGCTGIVWQSGTKGTSYRIPVTGTGDAPGTNAFTDMFKGNTFVSGAGMPESGIPTVNTDYYYSDFVIFKGGEPFALTLSSQFIYSVDDGVNWTVGYDVAIPSNANNEIWVKHNPAATYNRFRFANNTTITITGDKVGIDGKLVDLVGPEIQCAYLFEGQTGLTDISKLIFPSYTRPQCYMGMFKGTSVDMPATLPATQLATNCYVSMFEDCVGISWSDKGQEYTVGVTGGDQSAVKNMFKGCSTTPTSTMPADGTPVLGETYYIEMRLFIMTSEKPFTLYAPPVHRVNHTLFEYSLDDGKTWLNLLTNTDNIQAGSLNNGSYGICFRGIGTTLYTSTGISSVYPFFQLDTSNTEKVYISGYLDALLNYKKPPTSLEPRCFCGVIGRLSSSVWINPLQKFTIDGDNFKMPNVEEVPEYAYYCAFSNYVNVQGTLILPSSKIGDYGYSRMFEDSRDTTRNNTTINAVIIKGSEFGAHAMEWMFYHCKRINSCDMNEYILSAGEKCFYYSFGYTTLLNFNENAQTTIITDNTNINISAFTYMFMNATSLQDLSNLIFIVGESNKMVFPFTSLCQGAKDLKTPFTIIGMDANTLMCENQFNRTFASTSISEPLDLPMMNLSNSCYYYMYSGCKQITYCPELPATVSKAGCYSGMFNGTSVTEGIDIKFSNISSSNKGINSMFAYTPITTMCTYKGEKQLNKNCVGENMYSYCPNLTNDSLSDYDIQDLDSYMFRGSTGITSIEGIECYISMGCFQECTGLTSVNIPNVGIDKYSFMGCTNLIEANVGRGNANAFSGCTSLKTLTINDGYNASTNLFISCEYMCNNCTSLEEVKLLGPHNYNMYNPNYAFNGCVNLKRITLAPGLKLQFYVGKYTNTANNIFEGCVSLESLPELTMYKSDPNVTALTCKNLFDSCTQIKLVGPDYPGAIPYRIPSDGTNYEEAATFANAFKGCTFDPSSLVPSDTGTIEKNTTYYYVIE